MAVSQVQNFADTGLSGSFTNTAVPGSPFTAGNLLEVCCFVFSGTATTFTVTATGLTFTPGTTQVVGPAATAQIFYAKNIPGGVTPTINVSSTAGGGLAVVCAEYSGLSTTSPFVQDNGNFTSGANQTATLAATAGNLISFLSFALFGTVVAPTATSGTVAGGINSVASSGARGADWEAAVGGSVTGTQQGGTNFSILLMTEYLAAAGAALVGGSPLPLPYRGPASIGPLRAFVPALAPLGRAGIASGSIGTITLTAPLGAALVGGSPLPLPFAGPSSVGPRRRFVPALAALARQGIAIGTVPTITLTAPLGAALGALGTPNALPWTGPITRGPSRRFVPSLAPLGQQGFASGSVGTITLTAPLGAALGGIGTSLGPPSYGPASFGPIRQFRPGPQSFAAINTSGPVTGSGSIPTITLTAPSGAALGALGTTLEPPSIGPITWGPARRFVPALAALARQGIAIGTIPTITLTAPSGAALGALGTTLEPPSYAPLSQGPRRIFQARPQAFALIGTSGPVTGSGSIGTITLTAPLGAALGELATASPLPFAGPSSVGPRRRFVPALAPLGRAGIASGSIGTITLTAPLGAALGARGTPLAPPERGPSTVGPRRAFVFGPQAFAPITSSGPVTGSGSIGTITLTAPSGAAGGYIGTPLALPARGPVTQGPKRAFSSLGQAFAPYVYAAIGVGSIPTLTLSAPTGAALGFQGSVTGAPTRGPRSVGPRRTFSTIGAATAPSAFFGVGPIPTITLTAPTGIATSVPFGINAPGVTCLVVPSISVVCEVVPSISVVCEVVPSISVVCEVVGTASKS